MWTILYVLAGGIGLFALYLLTDWQEGRRLDRATTAFLAGRQPASDTEFVAGCHGAGQPFALVARRQLAESCGVSAEMIHPTDTINALCLLQHVGGGLLDMVFHLERQFGIKLARGDPSAETAIGEYIGFLASQVSHAVS